ncbi:hypothetical protein AVEN_204205-1 [Araneus ventricosus]|uniref:Uncharacterized protein n=1 Tax=Araneus ventricosus TaxID=182803 RepID=A0A4Y2CCV5_ARAVE|nr:hypothetical protein AVEN_204205-1 [Araneus ventricosus]
MNSTTQEDPVHISVVVLHKESGPRLQRRAEDHTGINFEAVLRPCTTEMISRMVLYLNVHVLYVNYLIECSTNDGLVVEDQYFRLSDLPP